MFCLLRRIRRNIIVNIHGFSCKVRVFLVGFHLNLNFLEEFEKNSRKSYFIKIRPVGPELLHAGRRTDRRTDGQNDR